VTQSYRCWAEVDLDVLRSNLVQIRAQVGSRRKLLVVVKADAYGHGLRQIAAVLMEAGADFFGVANLAEARAVRAVGKGWPILMLGACLPFEVDLLVREGVAATVSTVEEARLFSASAVRQSKSASVHLKLDTGMGRLGVLPAAAGALLEELVKLPALSVDGAYTHFSSAEDDAEFTAAQRRQFNGAVAALKGARFTWVHASNSGGLLLEPDDACNLVRVGLLVYGILPPGKRLATEATPIAVTPALSWKARVSGVREVPAGTPVSYGHTFITPAPMRLATITVGYADGYLRSGSNHGRVLVGGELCPVLGRITMDQTIVDVSLLDKVQTGDEVVLIGLQGQRQITATDLAAWCDSIPWEVLTNISYRVPRIYRGTHAA
jgi:alanine racemase